MTDLEKKVKEVVDEIWMAVRGGCGQHSCAIKPPKGLALNGPCGCKRIIGDYIARILTLCQQDAERREEEAFEAGRKMGRDTWIGGTRVPTWAYDSVAAYKSHRSERSRKEQEGERQ